MEDLSKIPDDELIMRLDALVAEERRRLPELLAHIGEVDDRKALIKRGYSSTFDYCTRKLNYSEDEAYRRIHVARKARSYPEIYSYLAEGRHSLSTLSKVAPNLNDENRAELLERSADKSLREVEKLVAPLVERRLSPRIVPILRPASDVGPPAAESLPAASKPREADRYSFEAPRELRDLVERSKDLLWHKVPFGQLDAIFLEWGREWLKNHDGLGKPALKASSKLADGDRPPEWVRRTVWKRDGGRCAYVAKDGTRCQTRRGLELDHVIPRSLGGDHSPENTRLLCRPHNDEERRRVLGEGAPPDPPSGPQPGLFS